MTVRTRGRQRRRHQPEAVIQRAVFQHLRSRGVPATMAWHTPNGGKRGQIEAAIFKSLGVMPGIPDVLGLANGRLHALELKATGRSLTPAQRDTLTLLKYCGAEIAVADSLEEALEILEDWGLLRGTTQ